MDYNEFLNRIINDGIEAAKADYTSESEVMQLQGSIAGFEACRNLLPEGLVNLLITSATRAQEVYMVHGDDYWYHSCYHAEVEWVVNVVSAMLVNQGQEPLASYLPTARGVMKAAEIIGVSQ